MKIIIENKFYPSFVEMYNCAQILYNGLVEKNTTHILSIEEENLFKEVLKNYTQTYKRYTDKIIEDMHKGLDSNKYIDPRDNPLTDDDSWIHDVEMGAR